MVSEGFALLEKDGDKLGTWTMLLLGPDDPGAAFGTCGGC